MRDAVSTLCADKLSRTRGGRRGAPAARHPGARGSIDVAPRAGVSTATASLVLRGRPGPSAATADAVLAAAADLGYRPDRTASLLARHRTHLLGVMLDVTQPLPRRAACGRSTAPPARPRLRPRAQHDDAHARDERRAVESLLDFRCEALVLLGPQMTDADLAALAEQCPVVAIGRRVQPPA